MPRYICHFAGLFFEWSSIVDAPVSPIMTSEEFSEYYKQEYGNQDWQQNFGQRANRAVMYGTSSQYPMSLQAMISGNHAGPDGSELSFPQVIDLVLSARALHGLRPLQINFNY